jgi:hypothetical protein
MSGRGQKRASALRASRATCPTGPACPAYFFDPSVLVIVDEPTVLLICSAIFR